MKRLITVGRVLVSGCVVIEGLNTDSGIVGAAYVAIERLNIDSCIVASGRVGIERLKADGRVVSRDVVIKRPLTIGRVAVSVVLEKSALTPVAVFPAPVVVL